MPSGRSTAASTAEDLEGLRRPHLVHLFTRFASAVFDFIFLSFAISVCLQKVGPGFPCRIPEYMVHLLVMSVGAFLVDISDALVQRCPELSSAGVRFCTGAGDVLAIMGGSMGWFKLIGADSVPADTGSSDGAAMGQNKEDTTCNGLRNGEGFVIPTFKGFVAVLILCHSLFLLAASWGFLFTRDEDGSNVERGTQAPARGSNEEMQDRVRYRIRLD